MSGCRTSPAGRCRKPWTSPTRLAWPGPVTVQPQYTLLARGIEWEVVPACQSEGLGLLPWSPLASGWLSGKYQRDQPPAAGTRAADNADEGMRIWNQRG